MTAATVDEPFDMSRRDERALAMRVAGVPMDRIAATFGWTIESTHEAVERALTRVTVDRNPDGVQHTLGLQQARLDALLESIWPSATDPTGHPIIQQGAVKTALGILDRQANLMGTNAPKQTIVTHNVDSDQIAATMERLFEARSGIVEADVVGTTPAIEAATEVSAVEDRDLGTPDDAQVIFEAEIVEDQDP